MIKDYNNDMEEINKKLEQFGYNMGTRMIDEFLVKNDSPSCANFRQVGEKITKGFKDFLGVSCDVGPVRDDDARWKEDPKSIKSFLLTFNENPLDLYVEVPKH